MTDAKRIEILISSDRMEADAFIPFVEGAPPVTMEEFKQALAADGIVSGIVDDARIQENLDASRSGDVQFTAAAGKASGHGMDATITYSFADAGNAEPAREISATAVLTVKKDQVIAWKKPATRGEEGITITGETIPGEWGMDVTIKPGANVSANADNTEFTSQIEGSPVLGDNTLRVDPIFVVQGDVDSQSGNLDFDGTLHIKGSITDGFAVRASGNILIDGTIMAATVQAGGDMEIKGGIVTREHGTIAAGGSITARFIENSTVEANGDIIVHRAIMNSNVFSNRNVIVLEKEGMIIGGEISAYNEIAAKNIGSSSEVKTVLRVGHRFEGNREIAAGEAEIDDISKKIEALKKTIAVLTTANSDPDKLARAKSASIELEKQRRDIQIKINALKKKQAPNLHAKVRGEQIINEGVHISTGTASLKVSKALKFATVFENRDGSIAVSSYDERTGKMTSQNVAEISTKPKALICDDAKFMRVKLRDILESDGLRVVGEAEDGAQAVEKAKQLRPDIITMDITMPNMDGITAVQEIKKLFPKQVIVMISALGQSDKVRTSIMAGAADFVVKPFDPEKVKGTIRQVLAAAKK